VAVLRRLSMSRACDQPPAPNSRPTRPKQQRLWSPAGGVPRSVRRGRPPRSRPLWDSPDVAEAVWSRGRVRNTLSSTSSPGQDLCHPSPFGCPDQPSNTPDTPSERASNERHERHFSVRISPVTPTPHIMRTHKTAGQEPFAAGSSTATHST
jgi:hypothetical protein